MIILFVAEVISPLYAKDENIHKYNYYLYTTKQRTCNYSTSNCIEPNKLGVVKTAVFLGV